MSYRRRSQSSAGLVFFIVMLLALGGFGYWKRNQLHRLPVVGKFVPKSWQPAGTQAGTGKTTAPAQTAMAAAPQAGSESTSTGPQTEIIPTEGDAAANVALAGGPENPATPKVDVDTNAEVVVLCYHRLEGKLGGDISIDPNLFEQHMQSIRDAGLSVISMQDFLAWRRSEKSIPARSIIITIDDGYVSTYNVAWPILKKFGYPFTVFVYNKFISAGGKSITWDQLGELRDAGVEIGSHTVSHQSLKVRGKRTEAEYEQWLRDEMISSKQLIEQRLGIKVLTLAYPYGIHNEKVRAIAREAGYEASFTVYGQRITHASPPDQIGRYAYEAKSKTDIIMSALKFTGPVSSAEVKVAENAAAVMVTQPMNGETITDAQPVLRANLASFGKVEPGSVEVRLGGIGLLPTSYSAETQIVEAQPGQPLRPGLYSVILGAKVNGRRVETRWSFTVAQ